MAEEAPHVEAPAPEQPKPAHQVLAELESELRIARNTVLDLRGRLLHTAADDCEALWVHLRTIGARMAELRRRLEEAPSPARKEGHP